MRFELGKYKILYIQIDGVYVPVAHLTNNDFNEQLDTITTTTRDNDDGWETYVGTRQRYTIPFSGIISEGFVSNRATYLALKKKKRLRALVSWKIEDSKGSDYEKGQGLLVQVGDVAPVNDLKSFECVLQGHGKPLILEGNLYIDSDYIDDYYE